MKNVPVTNISYITNGSPISADVLNGPSVGLMQNVSAIALAAETFSEEILTTTNLAASLVVDSDVTTAELEGNISQGFVSVIRNDIVNSSNITNSFYSIKLASRSESPTASQLEIYSKVDNSSKYVLKSSQLSSYYSGYSDSYKCRMLKNNGDSIALKIPRQESTSAVGLKAVSQATSVNGADLDYTAATQSGISLCKLPILDKITLSNSMTIGEFKGYFNSATSNQYALYFNAVGGVTIYTNNQAQQLVIGRFYVTVTDHSEKSKALVFNLLNDGASVGNISQVTDNTDIHGFTIDVDHEGAPWDYTTPSGSARTITIFFKLDSDNSYTQVYTATSSAFIPTQPVPDNYVYLPIATKTSSGIKFIDNVAPEILFTDSHIQPDSNYLSPIATSSSHVDLKYLRTINNSVIRLTSVVQTGQFFGRILLPEMVSKYIKHYSNLYDTSYVKLLKISANTIKKPALKGGVNPSYVPVIRVRTEVDQNNIFPGVQLFKQGLGSVSINMQIPDNGQSSEAITSDPTPSNLDSFSHPTIFQLISRTSNEMASNGSISVITYEITDSGKAQGSASTNVEPGTGSSQMSENIDTTSSYRIIVTADVLFSFGRLS